MSGALVPNKSSSFNISKVSILKQPKDYAIHAGTLDGKKKEDNENV